MAEVIDPLGKEAIDASKLFPNLAITESTAAGSSVATKHLPGDESDVEDDDGVLPGPVKKWPRDIPQTPKSHENRHLYYVFDCKL